MTRILYGAPVAEQINQRTMELLKNYGGGACLTIIQVGDLERSSVYVRQKMKACDKLGINYRLIHLLETVSFRQLVSTIKAESEQCTGMFLQLPLPAHLEQYRQEIIDTIPPKLDVDCLTTTNIGKMFEPQHLSENALLPATARGVLELLNYYEVPLQGRTVGVVGRSNLVGKPLIPLLLSENATVISLNSYTQDLYSLLKQCDIVIVAVGIPKVIKAKDLKDNAVVIDVGINAVEIEGKNMLVGDVDMENADNDYTPVPKGVGATTVASLMYNVASATINS